MPEWLKRLVDGTWTEAFAILGARYPWSTLAACALATGLGVWGMSHVKLDQDLKALLPDDYPSVTRLQDVADRMGTQSDLIVSVESPSRDANIAFGQALAERMTGWKELRFVQFQRSLEVFKDHGLLFMPVPDLLELRGKVIDRIRDETQKELIVDVDGEAAPKAASSKDDPLDMEEDELVERYLGGGAVPTEYMEADEGRIVVIKARPTELTTNVEFSAALVAKIEAEVAALDPARYHPELVASVKGEYLQRVGEMTGMRKDVLSTLAFAIGLLFAVIFVFFRRFRAIPVVLLPVVVSTIITLGIGGAIYGTFNLVTTFIFAILLGLGIDFAIHCLSRYGSERDRGRPPEEALRVAFVSTGNAVAMGAATTTAVFFLLTLGDFRGFSQFGAMAGMGVIVALFITFTMVPPLVVLAERIRPWRPRAARVKRAAQAPGRSLPVVCAAALVVSFAVGGFGLARSQDVGFEYDFTKLGPRKSVDPLAAEGKKDYRDAIGRVTTFAPAVALCQTAAQCEQVTRLLQAVKQTDDDEMRRARGQEPHNRHVPPPPAPADEDDPFATPEADPFEDVAAALDGGTLFPEQRRLIQSLGAHRADELRYFLQAFLSLQSFVPEHQDVKLRIIADIRERIDRKREALTADTQEKVDKFYRYLKVTEPMTLEKVPEWVREQLRDSEGELGRFIIMWNRGAKADYADSKRLHDAFFDLPAGDTTVPSGANYFVLVEIIDTLHRDGPIVLGAASLAVIVLVLLLFRSLAAALAIMVPLAMAIAWLAAIYLEWDIKVNMFSIIAFPLLIGMGIDYGIHIYHRWLEEGDVWHVVSEAGGAIGLTSVTTIIGFAGLLFANHVGIQTLGLTGALGIASCLTGSLITLPAMLYLVERWRATPRGGPTAAPNPQ
ncbi:MAG: hypothetical protein AMXMBFR64_04430 [Myxococcales bacterium]